MQPATIALFAVSTAALATISATVPTQSDTTPPQIIQHDQAAADLKTALDIALDDERKAKAFYKAVLEKFGDRKPFSNIVNAEARHEGALLAQYDRLNLQAPDDQWSSHAFEIPDSFQETCDASIVAEIENVAIYDRIDSMVTDEQVLEVFKKLRWASQERHLRAFTRHGSGWKTIQQSELTPQQSTQLDNANEANQVFFTSLITELTAALNSKDNNGGPTKATQVCSTRAPEIAQSISTEHNLQIGRTAVKLRNPSNTPPIWSRMLTNPDPTQRHLMTNTAGDLAVLAPITLAPTCLQCHGNQTDITPQTQSTLDTLYPNDQATGYKAGDHRGWFWIQVPPS